MRELKTGESGIYTKTGTLVYLSPERVNSEKFSFPADIWALGISLVYLATGKLPVPKDFWSAVNAIVQKPPPGLDRKQFSAPFCDFVDKCLQRDPAKRHTANQLLKHPFVM